MRDPSPEYKTTRLLLVVLALQGPFVVWSLVADPMGFFKFTGFVGSSHGTVQAWLLATVVTIGYVWSAASIPTVRQTMFRWNALKLLSIIVAIVAGIVEEAIFRKWVMDFLHKREYGAVVQVLASGTLFGIAHIMWGARSIAAGINAVLSTGLLGIGLGIVYLVGDRSLAPCIVAHVIITSLIEPGLILAAVDNKLGYLRARA